MGAQLKVTFSKPGSHHFKLIDRGDYFANIKTIGDDNQPTLTVTPSPEPTTNIERAGNPPGPQAIGTA